MELLIDVVFNLIFLLKPHFNYSSRFSLSWFDKLTTRAQSFLSVIEDVVPWFATAAATRTQFADEFSSRLIS